MQIPTYSKSVSLKIKLLKVSAGRKLSFASLQLPNLRTFCNLYGAFYFFRLTSPTFYFKWFNVVVCFNCLYMATHEPLPSINLIFGKSQNQIAHRLWIYIISDPVNVSASTPGDFQLNITWDRPSELHSFINFTTNTTLISTWNAVKVNKSIFKFIIQQRRSAFKEVTKITW